MDYRERGMALVSILFILALMMALVLVLTEKVWQSSQSTARAAAQERTFWAANAGIEWARARLANDYRSSGGWRDYLTGASGEDYPAEPVMTTSSDGISVEVYLRDNPDGDDDAHRDNDLRLYLLVRACGPLKRCSLIEALCGFTETTLPGYGSDQDRIAAVADGPGVRLPELAAEAQTYRVTE